MNRIALFLYFFDRAEEVARSGCQNILKFYQKADFSTNAMYPIDWRSVIWTQNIALDP